jgi:hypothetical protein
MHHGKVSSKIAKGLLALRKRIGDAINAILAACGFNMAKLVRAAALLARLFLLGYLFEFDRRGERSLDQALAAA